MQISMTMDLGDLAERMAGLDTGAFVTTAEARSMRAALMEAGIWARTNEVPRAQWQRLLKAAYSRTRNLQPVLVTCDGLDGVVEGLANPQYRTSGGGLQEVFFTIEQAEQVERAFPDLCESDYRRGACVLFAGTGSERVILPEFVRMLGMCNFSVRWRFAAEGFKAFDLAEVVQQ